MDKMRQRSTQNITKIQKMVLRPSADPEESIKTKVQPQYILKAKDRPDQSDVSPEFSNMELTNELKSLKASKRVNITESDGSVDKTANTSMNADGFGKSLHTPEQDDNFTAGIQTYFETFTDEEPLMNEMAQDFLTEMAMLGSEYDLRKLLGIPEPPKKSDVSFDETKDKKMKQISYLSALEATAVIAVFDKAIDQLQILKHLLPASSDNVGTRYKPMNARLGKKLSRSEWKEFEIPQKEPHPAQLCLKKIQNDREFVQMTLWNTARSLIQNNDFWPMKTVVEEQRAMMSEELIMAWKWPVTNIRMQQARKILSDAKRALAVMPIQHSAHMREMQEGMSHAMLTLETRKRYIERWEEARRFQHKFKLTKDEEKLRKKIAELGALTVDELRVSDEVTRFIGLEDRRIRAVLAAWEKRHEEEVEHVTIAILNSNLTLEVAQYHTQSVQKEYEGRVAELREWNARRENQTKRIEAALKIQKWWRHRLYRYWVAAALRVIKKARLEFAKFAKRIIEHAEALALIEPPKPETEEERIERERKERLEARAPKKKKEDGPSPEELIKKALQKLRVNDRMALSHKYIERKRYMMVKILSAIQALLGDVEARRILEADEAMQAAITARRQRRRMLLKAGAQGLKDLEEDEYSGLSDVSKDRVHFKRPLTERMTRPHIPGISPRFSTPLTDRLARASFAAKRLRKRVPGRPSGAGSLLKALQRQYKISGRPIEKSPGGRMSQVEVIKFKLKKIEERKAKEAAKEAARRKKLGLMI